MLSYSRRPRAAPTFVYNIPSSSRSFDDECCVESSPFASSSKMAPKKYQRPERRRPRGPSSASTLSSSSSSSSASTSSSHPYSYTTYARRYSPVPEPSDEDDDSSSELEFEGGAASSSVEDDAGEGWHYTYASSHRRHTPLTTTTSKPVTITLTTTSSSSHTPSSPTSPSKRILSDAHERRLSAELRRSPPPFSAHLPQVPPPSSYSPPARRSHLTRDSSTSLRRRTRREGWGEFDEKESTSPSSPSPLDTTPLSKARAPSPILGLGLELEYPAEYPASEEILPEPTFIDKEARDVVDVDGADKEQEDAEEMVEEGEEERKTPTCTDALAREWQSLVLRWRFGVFRAKRRVRGVFASTR